MGKFTDSFRKYTPREIKDWFFGKIRGLTRVGVQYVPNKYLSPSLLRDKLTDDLKRRRTDAVLGKMYFYRYDPKWKDKLDVYDTFPLVFPIEPYDNGFLGLNLHYLSVPLRARFLDEIHDYATAKHYTTDTKIKLTYELMKSSQSLSPLGMPCVHRYLFGHVRSAFIEVPATEWDKAYQLPVESFVIKRKKP